MAQYDITPGQAYARSTQAAELVSQFLRAVYGWMAAGLAVTAIVAMFIAGSPTAATTIAGTPILFYGIIIAQFGLVIWLTARVNALSASTASLIFLAYSALTGVTISFVLLAYTGQSVASTFFVTAGSFAALAVYGTVTKRSLQGMHQVLFMGLVGIVIASIVGIFWHSDMLQFVISVCGVIVFAGLTAYDAQRLTAMALSGQSSESSHAIVGALALYLDFINLFLFLLRFMGRRRD